MANHDPKLARRLLERDEKALRDFDFFLASSGRTYSIKTPGNLPGCTHKLMKVWNKCNSTLHFVCIEWATAIMFYGNGVQSGLWYYHVWCTNSQNIFKRPETCSVLEPHGVPILRNHESMASPVAQPGSRCHRKSNPMLRALWANVTHLALLEVKNIVCSIVKWIWWFKY